MTTTAQTAFRQRLRWVFIGTNGIRAGWSVLIFILLIAAVSLAINLALRFIFHVDPKSLKAKELIPWMLLGPEVLGCALIFGATRVMARIERRSVWSYGLRASRIGAKFSIGWAGGFLCLSALVALLAGGGFLVFNGVALQGASIPAYGVLWLLGFAAVGVFEENLFRGYIQYTLTRGMGFWPAALLSSLVFGAVHTQNHGETVIGIAEVVVAGMILCVLLRATGSLWVGIGFHAAWDWAQSYFYGTPDSGLLARGHLLASHAAGNAQLSGGATGPEGSALAAPVMIAGLLALVWLCRRPALQFGATAAVAAE